jgi:hypothetical protein
MWIRIQEPIECGSNAFPDSDPKHCLSGSLLVSTTREYPIYCSEQRDCGGGWGANGRRTAPTHLPPQLHPPSGHASRPSARPQRAFWRCGGRRRSGLHAGHTLRRSTAGWTVPIRRPSGSGHNTGAEIQREHCWADNARGFRLWRDWTSGQSYYQHTGTIGNIRF